METRSSVPHPQHNAPIAILTDFGVRDPFVGIMKGVIANIAPFTPMIDITHAIPPANIQQAAITLWQARSYFPTGTTFLCVVDPGVGTDRVPIILDTAQARFIGPGNGLFSYVLDTPYTVWQLQNPQYRLPAFGNTFHGRDIFAPAAAYAAQGVPGAQFGELRATIVRQKAPYFEQRTANSVGGEILFADQFGNILTSIGRCQRDGNTFRIKPWFGNGEVIQFSFKNLYLRLPDQKRLRLVRTFAEIAAQTCAGLIGSSGLIEIAANQKSAWDLLHLKQGERVHLIWEG